MNKVVKAPIYENNPFFVAINGLEMLFKKAQAIGITFAVVAFMSVIGSLPTAFIPPTDDTSHSARETTEDQVAKENEEFAQDIAAVPMFVWVLLAIFIFIIVIVAAFFGLIINALTDYTAAQLAHGRDVGLSDALHAVFSSFWGYLWVMIVAWFKTVLWTLLFIIPGIIMSVRYSLAGVVYFDKKLGGNGSVKESARLTKGGWLTTYASHSLFNFLTGSMIALLLFPGTRAILYRQFDGYDKAKLEKPAVHVLSWLTLIIPFVLLGFIILVVAGLILLFSMSNS